MRFDVKDIIFHKEAHFYVNGSSQINRRRHLQYIRTGGCANENSTFVKSR